VRKSGCMHFMEESLLWGGKRKWHERLTLEGVTAAGRRNIEWKRRKKKEDYLARFPMNKEGNVRKGKP